jgi:hypothetical protein
LSATRRPFRGEWDGAVSGLTSPLKESQINGWVSAGSILGLCVRVEHQIVANAHARVEPFPPRENPTVEPPCTAS